MKIVLNKCDSLDDWYTIIRAEHDGRSWNEKVGKNTYSHRSSERLSPEACIEGDSYQMIALAKAIKHRETISFKRCAVSFEDDGVHFWSPKNSKHDGVVTIEEADALAAQILAEVVLPTS